MNHLGTKTIDTQRLCLRRFEVADAQAMYQNWASDPDVTKYLMWPTHESEQISREIIADWVRHYGEENYYQWAIVPKNFGQPIGSIAAVHIDDRVGKVEIGYCIGRSWWHQGIMTEALNAVIDFFFEEVGANRVEACHDPNNPNSGAVMKKCGMTYEGTHRQAGRNQQGICDRSWHAILSSDRN